MLERRNSDRVGMSNVWVKEENGEYLFSYSVKNISEEGLFLDKKMPCPDQEPFSRFTFSLPDGTVLRNITGRLVREVNKSEVRGSAVQFMNLSEEARIALKRFILGQTVHGNA